MERWGLFATGVSALAALAWMLSSPATRGGRSGWIGVVVAFYGGFAVGQAWLWGLLG